MRTDTQRTAGIAVLVVLTVAAMMAVRGTLPGYTPPRPPEARGGPAMTAAVLVLLALSIVILLVGLVGAVRASGTAAPEQSTEPPRWQWEPSRPTTRQTVVVVAAVIAVLVALMALSSLTVGSDESDQPVASSAENAGPNPTTVADPAASEDAWDPDMFDYVALSAVVLVSLSVVGVAVVTGRARRAGPAETSDAVATTSPPADGTTTVSETLARAAELGLAEMAEPGREPREAIIACYAAMERALAAAPDVAPRVSDTPSEVLARAVDHGVLRTGAAAQLVALFTEARFSPHRMVEAHRESAVRHMRAVLDDVRVVRRP